MASHCPAVGAASALAALTWSGSGLGLGSKIWIQGLGSGVRGQALTLNSSGDGCRSAATLIKGVEDWGQDLKVRKKGLGNRAREKGLLGL